MPPAVIRGFRLAYGSWKIIWIRRRMRRSSSPSSVVTSSPSNAIVPAVGLYSRTIARPVVLLPQPDSPTSPRVSPRRSSNETPSTARTSPTWRSRMHALGDREPDLEVLDPEQRASPSARSGAARSPRHGPASRRRRPAERQAAAAGRGRASAGRSARSLDVRRLGQLRHAGQLVDRPGGGAAVTGRSGRPATASSRVGGLWHAIRWVARRPVVTTALPGATGASAGLSVQQRSSRHAQRGANGQPVGAWRMSGGRPSIGISGSPSRSSTRGIECSRPTVYGWDGAVEQVAGRRASRR